MEKRLSEAVLTRFQVANPDDSDVALKKAGVAYCAAGNPGWAAGA